MLVDDLSDEHPIRQWPHGDIGREPQAPLRVQYRMLDAHASLPPQLLAVVRFGVHPLSDGRPAALPTVQPSATQPLMVDVPLASLQTSTPAELWLASGPVRSGQDGIVRYAHDDHFLFAAIEIDERLQGGIRAASTSAYAAIRRFQARSPFPHLQRMWNYFDAINEGAGDMERYRQFCVGRVHGLDHDTAQRYPAATAIGHQHTTHRLQVFWLAGRHPGTAIENPRQVSAYRYPRAHGPVSPSFSRATLTGDGAVLISGTASIVGHASQHPGDPGAQLEETLRNLAMLDAQADNLAGSPTAGLADKAANQASQDDSSSRRAELLKIYVREPGLIAPIAARLKQTHPASETIFLAGDICRRELLLEIEGIRPSKAGSR